MMMTLNQRNDDDSGGGVGGDVGDDGDYDDCFDDELILGIECLRQ